MSHSCLQKPIAYMWTKTWAHIGYIINLRESIISEHSSSFMLVIKSCKGCGKYVTKLLIATVVLFRGRRTSSV